MLLFLSLSELSSIKWHLIVQNRESPKEVRQTKKNIQLPRRRQKYGELLGSSTFPRICQTIHKVYTHEASSGVIVCPPSSSPSPSPYPSPFQSPSSSIREQGGGHSNVPLLIDFYFIFIRSTRSRPATSPPTSTFVTVSSYILYRENKSVLRIKL